MVQARARVQARAWLRAWSRVLSSVIFASKLLDGTSLADLGKQNMLTGGGIGPKATHHLS